MIFDISPPLHATTPVWPGDVPLRREVALDLERGDPITLSSLHATVHLGAHADAPNHYRRGGVGIGHRPLEPYLGPCQLIAIEDQRGPTIPVSALPGPIRAPRILLRTATGGHIDRFATDFLALSPELIEKLAAQGVLLVGVDTPSVDPFDSKLLPAHHACDQANIAILEGLVLDQVPPGLYELIALPLRLIEFDASPVRAVLRSLPDSPMAR
jgi:arylformamidase